MNKFISKIKFIGTFLVVAAMCVPTMKAQAAVDTYTVTFRPGNVGCFAISAESEGDKQAKAEEVAAQVYGGYTYEVTKNGAIKVTVPANGDVPNAPAYIQAETGYFVKDTSVWGPASGQHADKNMDFVVDYGKLVNGVEYTVEYVDSSSGESIAPIYIAQANIGEVRTETAPKQIVISEATVYNLTSEETLELVLDADSTKNVFTFSYTMAPRGTVEEEVVNYIDGGTVTVDETFTTFINNGTTVTTTPAQGGAGGGEAENGQGTVVIEDENVPLAPPAEEDANSGNMVNIGEEDVPLASFEDGNVANTIAIVAGIFVLAAIAVALIWLRAKKKKKDEEENTQDVEKE